MRRMYLCDFYYLRIFPLYCSVSYWNRMKFDWHTSTIIIVHANSILFDGKDTFHHPTAPLSNNNQIE